MCAQCHEGRRGGCVHGVMRGGGEGVCIKNSGRMGGGEEDQCEGGREIGKKSVRV